MTLSQTVTAPLPRAANDNDCHDFARGDEVRHACGWPLGIVETSTITDAGRILVTVRDRDGRLRDLQAEVLKPAA